uniref:Uncharacterized protein n=1 Tax=Lactuca sativa TaxID=4236 RepID=A0A9R1W625_LACSA|nr:hypothetical protein LSAT_V11C300107470 [Lactuca sativa]
MQEAVGSGRGSLGNRQQVEIVEFQALKDEVSTFVLRDSADVWKSPLSVDGKFYVHGLRSLIDSFLTAEMYNVMPIKINCFGGLASVESLLLVLSLREVFLPIVANAYGVHGRLKMWITCLWVALGLEMFYNRFWVGAIFLSEISIPSGSLSFLLPSNGESRAKSYVVLGPTWSICGYATTSRWGNCLKKCKVLLAIFYGYMCIWRARNNRLFSKDCISKAGVFDNVKHRGPFVNCI